MKNVLKKTWILFPLLCWIAAGAGAQESRTLAIGSPAPDFDLPGVDGKRYTLENFSGSEVLVVVFSANHCPTAQAYEERIARLVNDYPPEKMSLVAISSNHPEAVCLEELGYSDLGDSFGEMKIRAADRAYPYPYLYDGETQEVATAYGARATPHLFIFDRERKLRYSGRFDEMEDPYREPEQHNARDAIDALLSGRPVPVETTRAFGCSMKWKSKMAWRQKLDQDWANMPVEVEEIREAGTRELVANGGEKLRLINIWATWCGPCIIEFPELVKMQRMYGKRGFEVVSVSMDRPEKSARVLEFLKEQQAAFANYLYIPADREAFFDAVDPDWQGNLPYTMLVEPGGKVVYRHDGAFDPLEVRKAVIDKLGRYFADD